MGGLAAADIPAAGGNETLLTVIGGIVVAALGSASVVGAAAFTNRNKNATSGPDPTLGIKVFERVAVVERRTDDNDERDDVQDRRLDQIERVLDIDNPEWRHR